MDNDRDGFLPGFDLGQALLRSGMQIDPSESSRYLQGAEVVNKGVQYYRFLELLLDGRQEPRSSYPPRSQELAARGDEILSVTLTALVSKRLTQDSSFGCRLLLPIHPFPLARAGERGRCDETTKHGGRTGTDGNSVFCSSSKILPLNWK